MQYLIELARNTAQAAQAGASESAKQFLETAFQNQMFNELATSFEIEQDTDPKIMGNYGLITSKDYADEVTGIQFRFMIGFYDSVIRLMIDYYDADAAVYNPVADAYVPAEYNVELIGAAIGTLQSRFIGYVVANNLLGQ